MILLYEFYCSCYYESLLSFIIFCFIYHSMVDWWLICVSFSQSPVSISVQLRLFGVYLTFGIIYTLTFLSSFPIDVKITSEFTVVFVSLIHFLF